MTLPKVVGNPSFILISSELRPKVFIYFASSEKSKVILAYTEVKSDLKVNQWPLLVSDGWMSFIKSMKNSQSDDGASSAASWEISRLHPKWRSNPIVFPSSNLIYDIS